MCVCVLLLLNTLLCCDEQPWLRTTSPLTALCVPCFILYFAALTYLSVAWNLALILIFMIILMLTLVMGELCSAVSVVAAIAVVVAASVKAVRLTF